tara:strand:+ start:7599 stop:7961 length:363 start_codon:yes stop_codon:yes gene_type:complete
MSEIDKDVFLKLKDRMKANFPKLLEIYLRDAEKYLASIESNLSDGDWDEVIIAAHTLKSASVSLGIIDLSQKAGKMESDARSFKENNSHDFGTLRPDFEGLKNSFSIIEGDLRAELTASS